jgi:hypothetical protein
MTETDGTGTYGALRRLCPDDFTNSFRFCVAQWHIVCKKWGTRSRPEEVIKR